MLKNISVEELKRKLKNLECPFCPHKSKNFGGLRTHIMSIHSTSSCPLCDFKGKELQLHLAKSKDEAHLLLYAVLSSRGHHRRREKLRKIRDELFGGE